MSTDKNIVSLTEFRSERAPRQIAQVEAYWEDLRGGHLMPSRADINPTGIADALSHAFVLERIAPGLARMRVAGTHLNDLMGMEVRGMPISTMLMPDARAAFSEALEAVFSEPAILRLGLESPGGFDRDALEAEMIILPLKSDLGDVTRAIGCLVSDGKIGRVPRRFSIARQNRRTLIGYADPVAAEQVQAAEEQEPFAPAPRPDPGKPFLRLVEDDETL